MPTAVQDMCIDHRCSHVFVTQEFLDRADVISILQKIRGKGMAQGMTGRPFDDILMCGNYFEWRSRPGHSFAPKPV